MMRTLLAVAFSLGAITGAAQAMPLAPVATSPSGDVIAVAGGCGAGWHRGPYGGCLRNYANPAAHACPRGYHIGPAGAVVTAGNSRPKVAASQLRPPRNRTRSPARPGFSFADCGGVHRRPRQDGTILPATSARLRVKYIQ